MKKLLKQALDALEPDDSAYREERVDRAIAALRAELAKPDPEPVAWIMDHASWSLPIVQIAEPTSLGLRSIMRPLYAAPAEPNCQFPTCRSQEFQSKLADEVASELITHIPAPRGFIAQPSIDGVVRTSTTNCSRHPDVPHGQDGAGCKCHSWAPGEAS